MTNSDLKEFIEKYKKSIDNREYEEVFNQALLRFGANTGKFVDLFYKCGIDPLKYMSKVPDYYAINSNLRSITIPGNITSVGRKAFSDCHLLMSVTISGGVTSIDDGAFYNCTSLTSVTMGNGVTSIGSRAFSGCSSLINVTIPDSVISIDKYAFYNCTDLNINYAGSKEQWNSINKKSYWNLNAGIKSIVCKDGIINI